METIRYATLALARAEINVPDEADTSGDAYLLEALRWIAERIDQRLGFSFAPWIETRYFNARGDQIDDDVLYLDAPLLAAASVTDNAGATWTKDTHWREHPRGRLSTWALRAILGSGLAWEDAWSGDWREAIAVAGTWGYRAGYPTEGWIGSADTLASGGGLGSTTFTLTGGPAGADTRGRAPRFSAGQLVKLDDEFCEILATDDTAKTLTVRRAARGSTEGSHANGTAIAVWRPEPDIERATLRWASYLYKRRGMFEQTQYDGVATVQFPTDATDEVEGILAAYTDEVWAASMRAV